MEAAGGQKRRFPEIFRDRLPGIPPAWGSLGDLWEPVFGPLAARGGHWGRPPRGTPFMPYYPQVGHAL